MKKIFLLFFVIAFVAISAQDDNDFPTPRMDELPGAAILSEKYFDGSALWGHIDGGADLYLEYGFDKLLFQEIEWNKIKFRVEFYRMKDYAAAFGIFSVSRFNCQTKDTITKYICITPYQVQAALGKYYISIANEKGTNEARNLGIDLFGKILAKHKGNSFQLPEPFTITGLTKYLDNIKFFRGTLGLQNGLSLWVDFFESFSNYEITALPIESGDGYLNFALIKFANEEDRIRFMRTIGVSETKTENRFLNFSNGIYYIVKIISDREIYFYETVFDESELKNIFDE
jgi:hypothetical protein